MANPSKDPRTGKFAPKAGAAAGQPEQPARRPAEPSQRTPAGALDGTPAGPAPRKRDDDDAGGWSDFFGGAELEDPSDDEDE